LNRARPLRFYVVRQVIKMKKTRILSALVGVAALVVAGCTPTTDVSRNLGLLEIGPVADVPRQNWDFAELVVNVPRTLSVSEAHGIKPRADIVWREDAPSDRYVQVEGIMRDALAPALRSMQGDVPVQVVVELTRFHALSERSRYTIGGQHEIEFVYVVRHAETGALLAGPEAVDLTFRALGGQRAVEAEQQGITQRVRITERLVGWVQGTFPVTGVSRPPAT
jgi:hypothetical protein